MRKRELTPVILDGAPAAVVFRMRYWHLKVGDGLFYRLADETAADWKQAKIVDVYLTRIDRPARLELVSV